MIVSPYILDRKVTRDFYLREWACHCRCGLANPHPALAMGSQRLRELLAVAVTIGSRCCSLLLGCADKEVQGDTAAQRTLIIQQAAKIAAEDGPLTLISALAEYNLHLMPAKYVTGRWSTTG